MFHWTHNRSFWRQFFQTVNCTGTDNQTTKNRKYTKHKTSDHKTNKLP